MNMAQTVLGSGGLWWMIVSLVGVCLVDRIVNREFSRSATGTGAAKGSAGCCYWELSSCKWLCAQPDDLSMLCECWLLYYIATASGGYGSSINPYSDAAQRGQPTSSSFQSSEEGQPQSFDSKSLVSQSLSGGDLSGELQDAKQGVDEGTRREVGPDGGPKGYNESWESREEADGRLGAPTRYTR